MNKRSTWLCEICGAEPPTLVEYKQHKADHLIGKVISEVAAKSSTASKVSSKPPSLQKTDTKPIILIYQYKGDCPKCNREVATLEVDSEGDKLSVVAYCIFCKKQYNTQKVQKLKTGEKVKNKKKE